MTASPAPPFIIHGTPAFLRTNLALFAAGVATFALIYCVQPLLPLFSAEFMVDAAQASLALSLTTAVLAVALLAAAGVSEAVGRKPVMLASLLVSSVLTLAAAASGRWPVLLAVRAAMGITISGLPAVAMAYVSEEMHPRSVGLAMALYIAGSGLGGLLGRLLTGVVTDLYGWRVALAAIGLLGLVCTAVFWRSLPPSRHFTPREPRLDAVLRAYVAHLRDPALLALFADGLCLMGSFVTVYNYVGYRLLAPPFLLSQTQVGLIFGVYLLGIASSAFIGAATARFGRPGLLMASIGSMLLGTALTQAAALALVVAGMGLLTVGFFAAHAVASAWVGLRAQQARAQASSLYLFAYYAGSSVVGSLGGVFWSLAGWPGVTGMTGALLLVAMGLTLRLRRLAAG